MPIGVPKVEYRLPGEPEADWIDLYNCLYRERMLFLCQDLGDEVANQLISLMLYLNAEDPSQPFFMYINSLGGSVTCGIGVYDIMRYLESGITTICMGTASSMASFVLAGGTYGRRLSLPHGRIMIHQPEGGSDGQASEILSESSEVSRIRTQIGLIYANRTQQSIERIARDLDRDQFMSADEAKAYGLIDFVARTATDPGIDMLKLLTKSGITPKPFRDLAAAQSMDEARQAIRNLPEFKPNNDLTAFRTFAVNAVLTDVLESQSNRETEKLETTYTPLPYADNTVTESVEENEFLDWFEDVEFNFNSDSEDDDPETPISDTADLYVPDIVVFDGSDESPPPVYAKSKVITRAAIGPVPIQEKTSTEPQQDDEFIDLELDLDKKEEEVVIKVVPPIQVPTNPRQAINSVGGEEEQRQLIQASDQSEIYG